MEMGNRISLRQAQVGAESLMMNGEFEKAEQFLKELLEAFEYDCHKPATEIEESPVPSNVYSPVLRLAWNYAEVLHRMGDTKRALALYHNILGNQRRLYRDHTDWLDTLDNIVYLMIGEGQQAQAATLVHDLINPLINKQVLTDDQFGTVDRILSRLGEIRVARGGVAYQPSEFR